ncbi:transcriptional regulator, TrmB [Candidatus Haloredivivus sp. G17]|mgnify:CR=1 FL=1|jgi:predicted transcriptional regulator|nr:transcriptional regulator, TrmB [Candidatus Haloredivivus sp. G17]
MEFLEIEDKDEKQIVYEVFDLNDLQKSIFQALNDSKLTVQEIADEVGRNRSTVQRALQEMLEKDLLMREGKTDRTVYYVYTALPMEEIREVTSDALETWHEQVQSKLS